jgi:hypothetical protein
VVPVFYTLIAADHRKAGVPDDLASSARSQAVAVTA